MDYPVPLDVSITELERTVDIEDWPDLVISGVKQFLEIDGHIKPFLLFLASHQSDERKTLLGFADLRPFFRDENGKPPLSKVGPHILSAYKAFAVMFVSGSWVSFFKSLEEGKKLLAKYGGIENCPGSKEVIYVFFETKSEAWSKTIEIIRDGDSVRCGKEEARLNEKGRWLVHPRRTKKK